MAIQTKLVSSKTLKQQVVKKMLKFMLLMFQRPKYFNELLDFINSKV